MEMNNALGQVVTVFTAIVGVAMVAVLVSKRSQTPEVIQSIGKAFSASLNAATAPVSGGYGMQI
jgi:hypothetical protein